MIRFRGLMVLMVLTGFVVSAGAQGVLLIPESGGDNVWAFDPFDGSMISDNFIVQDGHFVTAIQPIDSGHGTILISDQSADAVFEYGYDGMYIRTVADNATSGIDNVRGLAVYNDQIYLSVFAGTYESTIQRFDMDGHNQTTWATGIGSPWNILFRQSDVLVTDSDDDNIERFDLAGNALTAFHDSDGVNGIDFPQQMYERANGNILAAGFSSPSGIYEYDANGNQVNYFNVDLALRGVYELGNGKILYTGGTIVGVFDPATQENSTIINQSGASFRHIGLIPIPEPTGLLLLALGGALVLRKR